MQVIFRLSSFLLLPLFLFAFENLYTINDKNFEIISTQKEYKLILKNQKFINYQKNDGFKFFIPYFTKEFNLKVLRYNSTGYINGLLSMNTNFDKIINASSSNLTYYFTDYKNEGRELSYLLKNYTVPYYKSTSLSLEVYNIPDSIQKKLNRYIYFKKTPLAYNKLEYILYSFYLVLDKKNVDNFIKTHYPASKNYIFTYLQHIYNINLTKKPKKTIKPHKRIVPYHLILTRIFQMKKYGYIPQQNTINKDLLINKIINIENSLTDLKFYIKSKLTKKIDFSISDKTAQLSQKIDIITSKIKKLQNIKFQSSACIFTPENINKKCFKNPVYFQNYITYAIKQGTLPSEDTILAYGDYRTYNDIGVYYYTMTNLQKAEIYLKKAYYLSNNNPIIIHNLAVLYSTHGEMFNLQKMIKYLKKSTLPIDYYNLGIYYYIGVGVKENNKIARKYFEKAQNINFAQKNLQTMEKFHLGK